MQTFVWRESESWESNAININREHKKFSQKILQPLFFLSLSKTELRAIKNSNTALQLYLHLNSKFPLGRALIVGDLSLRLKNANFCVCWESVTIVINKREKAKCSVGSLCTHFLYLHVCYKEKKNFSSWRTSAFTLYSHRNFPLGRPQATCHCFQ